MTRDIGHFSCTIIVTVVFGIAELLAFDVMDNIIEILAEVFILFILLFTLLFIYSILFIFN